MNNFKFYMKKVSPTIINERILLGNEKNILQKMIDFLKNYKMWKENYKALIKNYKDIDNIKYKNIKFIKNKKNLKEILKKSTIIYKLLRKDLADAAKKIEIQQTNNETTKKSIKNTLNEKSNIKLSKIKDIESTINMLQEIIEKNDTVVADSINFINTINSKEFKEIGKIILNDRVLT